MRVIRPSAFVGVFVRKGMKTGAFLLIALTLVPPSLSCGRFLDLRTMSLKALPPIRYRAARRRARGKTSYRIVITVPSGQHYTHQRYKDYQQHSRVVLV